METNNNNTKKNRSMKSGAGSLEKINKIYKPLARHIKEKKRKNSNE